MFSFLNGSGGAHLYALSTGHASIHIDFGFFSDAVKMDTVVRTGFDTSLAGGAGIIRNHGNQGADDADVLDLGLRACIGAFCEGDSELMVIFEVSLNMLFQER